MKTMRFYDAAMPMMPINLQLFADEAAPAGMTGEPGQEVETGATPPAGDDTVTTETPPEKLFTQAEVNKLMGELRIREREQREAAAKAAHEQGMTEAQRLAAMTAEERVKDENDRRIRDLEAREAKLARGEITAEALHELAKRGLPPSLGTCIS